MSLIIKIGIADDHQIVLDGLKFILDEFEDVEIAFTATSATRYLSYLNSHSIDVAVLDINLPDMSGIELAMNIKKSHPSMPIVFLTMHKTSRYIKEAVDVGAWGYVLKDSPKEELIQSIRSAFQGKTHYGSEIMGLLVKPGKVNHDYIELTKRELEVLKLVVKGLKSTEIGNTLNLSVNTIKTHRKNLMSKLPVNNMAELISYAIDQSLVSGK